MKKVTREDSFASLRVISPMLLLKCDAGSGTDDTLRRIVNYISLVILTILDNRIYMIKGCFGRRQTYFANLDIVSSSRQNCCQS